MSANKSDRLEPPAAPARAVEPAPRTAPRTPPKTIGEPLIQQIQLTPDAPAADRAPPSRRDERRSAERVACALDIEFAEEAHFFAGLTQDISEGGLFVATYRLLPVGTLVTLAFELPNHTRISGRGEVRWVRSPGQAGQRPGIGVAFTELSPEAMRDIAAFCAEHPPLYIEM